MLRIIKIIERKAICEETIAINIAIELKFLKPKNF